MVVRLRIPLASVCVKLHLRCACQGMLWGVATLPKEIVPFALKLSHITPTMTPAMAVPNYRLAGCMTLQEVRGYLAPG